MDLKRRYRAKTIKRVIRFFVYYSFLALFLLFYNTLARYTAVVRDTTTVNVANWNITINGQNVQEEQELLSPISLTQGITQTTYNNKLAPGQTGYFDIVIDPTRTDVSVEYSIRLNSDKIPSDIKLTGYEILEDNINTNIQNNTINGEINLSESSQALTQSDIKTLRIHWTWQDNDNTTIPTGTEDYYILATISVKQKISI